jgi:hypothetical protein
MNDFEIQRRLRAMNAERTPRTDLWSGIAARIGEAEAGATTVAHRGHRLPLAAAAAVLLAVAAGVMLQDRREPAPSSTAATTSPVDRHAPARISPSEAVDIARARGSDPRVLGASLVLDSAQDELAQALEQQPDAVFLVSLLNRTHAQRMKLERFGASAG